MTALRMRHGQPGPALGPAPEAVIARGLTATAPGGGRRPTSRPLKSGAVAADARLVAPLDLLVMLIVVAILAWSHAGDARLAARGGAESPLAAIVTVA
jgi:hypothetical protein